MLPYGGAAGVQSNELKPGPIWLVLQLCPSTAVILHPNIWIIARYPWELSAFHIETIQLKQNHLKWVLSHPPTPRETWHLKWNRCQEKRNCINKHCHAHTHTPYWFSAVIERFGSNRAFVSERFIKTQPGCRPVTSQLPTGSLSDHSPLGRTVQRAGMPLGLNWCLHHQTCSLFAVHPTEFIQHLWEDTPLYFKG